MLTHATDELTRERNQVSVCRSKMEVREKELLFSIKTLEDQLLFEKQRNNGDISVSDIVVKTEFQKR